MTTPLALLAAFVVLGFLPSVIALARGHHNGGAIVATNVIALLLPVGCGALTVGGWAAEGAPVATDIALVGGTAMAFGFLAGAPFWLGALIWSLTAVRHSPLAPTTPPPPLSRRAVVAGRIVLVVPILTVAVLAVQWWRLSSPSEEPAPIPIRQHAIHPTLAQLNARSVCKSGIAKHLGALTLRATKAPNEIVVESAAWARLAEQAKLEGAIAVSRCRFASGPFAVVAADGRVLATYSDGFGLEVRD